MPPSAAGNRAARDAINHAHSVWQTLLLLQIANALDWATSLIGVGVLGLPEQAPVARWMIAHLGVAGGMTMLKVGVALAFTAMAWGAAWLQRRRWAQAHHVVGLVWLMGVATGLLAQTVLSNVAAIWMTLAGGASR